MRAMLRQLPDPLVAAILITGVAGLVSAGCTDAPDPVGSGDELEPSFSHAGRHPDNPGPPDGRGRKGSDLIVFASSREGDQELYTLDPHRRGKRAQATQITTNTAHDGDPAWSPDRTQIAFVRGNAPYREIWLMNADGTGEVQLTDNSVDDVQPAWNPAGDRIVFARKGSGGYWDIWIMRPSGIGQVELYSANSAADDQAPHWSPNGLWIAFMSDRDGNYEIYVTDGGSVQRLTDNTVFDGWPQWSPDGNEIVFVSSGAARGHHNRQIYKIDTGSGTELRLTNSSYGDEYPTWSPDGARIAFSSLRGGNIDVFTMDADGSNERRQTDDPAFDGQPDW